MVKKQARFTTRVIIAIMVLFACQVSAAQAVINFTSFSAAKDSHIRQEQQTRNYGTNNQLRVQSRNNRNHRSLVQFNISSIPVGSTIENADLRVYLRNLPSGQRTYDLHSLTNSWLEGTSNRGNNGPGVNGVTWIERWYGDNVWTGVGAADWAATGADFTAGPSASVLTPAARGYMSWPVTADVDSWYRAVTPNYGWLIKDSVENGPGTRTGRFRSSETGNPARHPFLDVTFLRSGAALSTDTVDVGAFMPITVTLTNNVGPGGDEINQVSFNIPGGWGFIPTLIGDYLVSASGKTWNITGLPTGPDGPQTVTATAATALDDLADGESVDITFNVSVPWLIPDTTWTFSAIGAAGGTHTPADWTVGAIGGSLGFQPGSNATMSPANLIGLDTTTTGNLGLLSVLDARGSGAGWSVTLSSTDFISTVDPSQTIPVAGFLVPVAPVITVVGGSQPPTSAPGSLASPGLQLLNAPSGFGTGEFEVTPQLELAVPAETLVGTYSATITETIIGGL